MTPFFTASNSWKSPTTSFAPNGWKANSPPVLSTMPLHQSLKISKPMPPGQEVWIFQVVVCCAAALPTNGIANAAVAPAADALRKSRRTAGWVSAAVWARVWVWVFMECLRWFGLRNLPPRMGRGRGTNRAIICKPAADARGRLPCCGGGFGCGGRRRLHRHLRLLHRGDGGDAAAADGFFDALAGVARGGVTITVTVDITVTITAPA